MPFPTPRAELLPPFSMPSAAPVTPHRKPRDVSSRAELMPAFPFTPDAPAILPRERRAAPSRAELQPLFPFNSNAPVTTPRKPRDTSRDELKPPFRINSTAPATPPRKPVSASSKPELSYPSPSTPSGLVTPLRKTQRVPWGYESPKTYSWMTPTEVGKRKSPPPAEKPLPINQYARPDVLHRCYIEDLNGGQLVQCKAKLVPDQMVQHIMVEHCGYNAQNPEHAHARFLCPWNGCKGNQRDPNREFAAGSLPEHLRVHLGLWEVACSRCELVYPTKQCYTDHLKRPCKPPQNRPGSSSDERSPKRRRR